MSGTFLRGAHMVAGLIALSVSMPVAAQEKTDWSGFYAGIFAGYGLDSAEATSSSTPLTTVPLNGANYTFASLDYDQRFEAPFGGLQVGYNHQIDQFVLGVEGTLSLGSFSKSSGNGSTMNITDGVQFTNNTVAIDTNLSLDWLTTFSGKLGADLDGFLIYGKLGVAVANMSGNSRSDVVVDGTTPVGLLGLPNGTYAASTSHSALRAGPTIGAGVEKMLTENVSVGLEYNYTHLGDISVGTPPLGGIGAGGTKTFSANFHSVKAGISYHF